jgi:hypothetical protein
VNNSLQIYSLGEEEMHRVVFAKDGNEGGINFIFDPERGAAVYQVFIHKSFPLSTLENWEFDTFAEARSHAAKTFAGEWEVLAWDQKVKRPCADGGQECGSGSCEMCKSTGGGCKSCGASDESFASNS